MRALYPCETMVRSSLQHVEVPAFGILMALRIMRDLSTSQSGAYSQTAERAEEGGSYHSGRDSR